MTDLKDLKELANSATPGPWRDRAEKNLEPDGLIYGPDDEHDGDYRIVGSLKGRKGFGSVHWSQYTIPNAKQGYGNAAFIAAANPKTILELIARVEDAEENHLRKSIALSDMATLYNKVCSERDSLRTALEQAKAREAELLGALGIVERWELPETDETWQDGTPMSYTAAYGSNGARDFMRKVAKDARLAVTAMGGDDNG